MNPAGLFISPYMPLLRDPKNQRLSDLQESPSIALVGIPWDWGITGRPGARYTPSEVRKVLYSLKTHSPRYGDLSAKPRDLGDIRVAPGDWSTTSKRVTEAMSFVYRNYDHSIILGGDHSITEWTISALAGIYKGVIGILLLDAHYDMRSVEEGYTSGMWLWNIHEKYKDRVKVAIVGIGEYANPPYLGERAEEAGFKVISAEEVLMDPSIVYEAVEYLENEADVFYISVDMDHIDQAFAPGVNSPSILGLHPHHTVMLLEEAIPVLRPKAIDFVEVVPQLDHDSRTVRLTAYLVAKSIQILTQS